MTMTPSRRAFLVGAGTLTLGLALPLRGVPALAETAGGVFEPNAFIRVAPDDTVTVIVKHIEFGQGPNTGLATLVAEEMDADWAQMRAASAPADDKLYSNLAFGTIQGTGGSTAIANSYMQMRKAGAAARQMLVAAAAETWGVPAAEITIEKGILSHPSGRSSGFGALAGTAAGLPVPADPPVKDKAAFRLIGTDRPKLDTAAKTNGTAQFTMDIRREGMLTVVVAHPPAFGATVASFDPAAALAVEGVEMVRQIPSGVAVYARSTWPALKGRKALKIEWNDGAAETRSSVALMDDIAAAAASGGRDVAAEGDHAAAIAGAARTLEAEYRFPYLAHAPMEPNDAVIEVRDGRVDMWYGCQFPTFDRLMVAGIAEVPPENVTINVMLAGGSFGRRATGDCHFAAEAAHVAKAAGRDGAFKLVWTREDDIRGGYYRPATVHRLRAGLDADGRIVGWENVVANQSIIIGTPMEPFIVKDGIDATAFEGSQDLPYDVGAHRVGWARVDAKVPVLWWRSVGHTHTAYAVETFLDELLAAAGKDPVQGRLELLKPDRVRERGVIEAVAKLANWQGPRRDGKTYGVAYAKSFGTYVAEIVEVEDRGGRPHVVKVWVAVDCGVAVNPNVIRAQMEGGVGYGLSAALYSEVTLGERGLVQEGNFHDYRILRIHEMPQVEVVIVDSDADPTGVGEPGVPPLAPAVANAWRTLTGQATRDLPIVRRPVDA